MSGAVDNDYDDALKDAREEVEGALAEIQRDPVQGGLAIDLVTRQPLFIRRQVAETLVEYYEREGFDLSTYNGHPWLPITADDAVYECVFVPRDPGEVHKIKQTYDYPRGRLMTIPVWEAWGDDE